MNIDINHRKCKNEVYIMNITLYWFIVGSQESNKSILTNIVINCYHYLIIKKVELGMIKMILLAARHKTEQNLALRNLGNLKIGQLKWSMQFL